MQFTLTQAYIHTATSPASDNYSSLLYCQGSQRGKQHCVREGQREGLCGSGQWCIPLHLWYLLLVSEWVELLGSKVACSLHTRSIQTKFYSRKHGHKRSLA